MAPGWRGSSTTRSPPCAKRREPEDCGEWRWRRLRGRRAEAATATRRTTRGPRLVVVFGLPESRPPEWHHGELGGGVLGFGYRRGSRRGEWSGEGGCGGVRACGLEAAVARSEKGD